MSNQNKKTKTMRLLFPQGYADIICEEHKGHFFVTITPCGKGYQICDRMAVARTDETKTPLAATFRAYDRWHIYHKQQVRF